MKIHFTSSKIDTALKTKNELILKYNQTPIKKAEVIVAIGGDGAMLKALRDSISINIPVFGLPGNPVSSYVCFVIFIIEAIKKLLPCEENYINRSKAYPLNKLINNSQRETYFRGKFFTKNNRKYVDIFDNQDSSLMKNLSEANCLVKVPAKRIVCSLRMTSSEAGRLAAAKSKGYHTAEDSWKVLCMIF